MSGPVGLNCPACGEPPRWLFSDTQDPTKSRAELNADSGVIDLPFEGGSR